MTALLDRALTLPENPSGSEGRTVRRSPGGWAVRMSVLLVVVLRLPFVQLPAGSDEGGFLAVAGQWHAGGSSLYGNYWVDRPPLLIAIFQAASGLGGLTALRLIGCAAAALTVLGVSTAARQVAGQRGAGCAAVVSAALLVSPLMGMDAVDGELLAAPFTAAGISLMIAAVRSRRPSQVRWPALGAGACAAGALLVKQNMAEVTVFTIVVLVVGIGTRAIAVRRVWSILGFALTGGVAATGALALWTVGHGTSLVGVFDAMYPFRIKAAQVIVDSGGTAHANRFLSLMESFALSAVPLLMAAFAWQVVRGRLRDPIAVGLLVTLVFSTSSILLGGNYWAHYLVEIIVPVAISTAMIRPVRPRLVRDLVAVVVVVAAVAWGAGLVKATADRDSQVGTALRRSSLPGDTIIVAFGNADIVEPSRLSSPYPYLWSLPAHTLDPGYYLLTWTLAGPRAPTWFVPRNSNTLNSAAGRKVAAVLRAHYRPVAEVCGRVVYLHDGLTRPVPRAELGCAGPSERSSALDRLVHAFGRPL
ncbi:MAG: hypothetical protein JWR85_1108 [Marmoricola sp.]|nr:hypothetical protein [Marmoricola sp.]